jgi:hypothetical protein
MQGYEIGVEIQEMVAVVYRRSIVVILLKISKSTLTEDNDGKRMIYNRLV